MLSLAVSQLTKITRINHYQWKPEHYKFSVTYILVRGEFRRIAKFLLESNTFHIKSKAIKMLSYKKFATFLDLSLLVGRGVRKKIYVQFVDRLTQHLFYGYFLLYYGEKFERELFFYIIIYIPPE